MKKLSTGDDSTLGNYRKLSLAIFGEDSPQVRFLEKEIEESGSPYAEVIQDESQMLLLLGSMMTGGDDE